MSHRRDHAAKEVKNEITYVTKPVLNVVAKDPEKQHIAANVHEATVHEHRRKKRDVYRNWCYFQSGNQQSLSCDRVNQHSTWSHDVVTRQNLSRDCRKGVGEVFVCSELLKKDKDEEVCGNQRVVNYWRDCSVRIGVEYRKYHLGILVRCSSPTVKEGSLVGESPP